MDQFHGLVHPGMVLRRQHTEAARVGIAPGTDHVLTGHQLRLHPAGHQNGHGLGGFRRRDRPEGAVLEVDRTGHRRELPGDRLEDRGFSGPVGTDQDQNFSRPHAERDIGNQRPAAVADGEVSGMQNPFYHIPTSPSSALLAAQHHIDDDRRAQHRRDGADAQFCGGKDGSGNQVAEQTEYRPAEEAGRYDDEGLRGAK